MARFEFTFANRWYRLAIITAAVAAAFAGARLIALGILFLGLAVWAVRRWRQRKRGLAFALAAALVCATALYGFAAFEVWRVRVWHAAHFGDIIRLAANGRYEGEGRGKRGPIKVELTVGRGQVEDVVVTEHYDTIPIATSAFVELRRRIVGRSDLDVDAVTGATQTSYGEINAARDAAWKAVPGAPKISSLTRAVLWFTSLSFGRATFHSLAVIFIVILLFDYTLQAALVEGTGQSLNCMDCQTCVGTCPVKRAEGRLFPMEMVLRARLGDYATVMSLAKYCVGCARCTAKCPAGISAPSVAAAVALYLRRQKRRAEAEFFEART